MTAGTAKVARIACRLKNLAQRSETLIGAEQRLGCREVGGGNTLRPRSDAQIDGDRNAAAGAIRPADIGIREAPLIGDRIALLPRHRRHSRIQSAPARGGWRSMQWRATCSQVGNHTPGSDFIRAISRSSIAMRSARPDWNGCMQTLR